MSKKGQVQHEIVTEFINGKLSRREASELLQVRERTITRIARRIEQKGFLGVIHGNRERIPANKKSELLREEVMKLVESKYYDFNMTP